MWVYIPYIKLPSAYQEVEYIESVWWQYINTWYLPSSAPKIEIDFMQLWNTTSDSWYAIYWRRWSSTSTYFCIYVNKSSPYSMTPNYAWHDPWANSWATAPINVKVNVVNDKWQFYVNWNYISASSTTNTLASASYPIYLFWNNITWTNQNRWTKMRLYSCKMWNDWTLERDFVPCYRKSDNVIWLYDLVNNQFYTNSWTGTFSKGNDVIMSELKNAYIGEEYDYVYDFRGKTTSQLTSDGWNLQSGASVDANWLTASSWGTNRMTLPVSVTSSTKKITMVWGLKVYNAIWTHLVDTSNSNQTWIHTNKSGNKCQVFISGSYTEYSVTWLINDEELTNVIDLENLTDTATYSWGATVTKTLTSTNVSNIRTYSKRFRIAVNSGDYVKYVKFKVE